MRKCDEVTKLTNDLFLHALSDMDKLQIKNERVDLNRLVANIVEMHHETCLDIYYTTEEDKIYTIIADPMQLEQILDNLIRNSEKYGKTPI